MWTLTFIVALFIIAKRWKQPKHPLTDEGINKMFIHAVEYYLAFKWMEILSQATTWMNLENILLRVKTQLQKDKYGIILLT